MELLKLNEMTKQEKIREAYPIDYWNKINNTAKNCAYKNNGWIGSILEHAPEGIDLDFDGYAFRPKSLHGIENNNGWIKIESEEDLPNIENKKIVFYGNGITSTYLSEDVKHDIKHFKRYTHYKIKEEELPPIY